MKAARNRVEKYRKEGGAADLIRVEVLVPPMARDEIVAHASRLRAAHRSNKGLGHSRQCTPPLRSAYPRQRRSGPASRSGIAAPVAARAMIDRGDARAFAMGREMLDRVAAVVRT